VLKAVDLTRTISLLSLAAAAGEAFRSLDLTPIFDPEMKSVSECALPTWALGVCFAALRCLGRSFVLGNWCSRIKRRLTEGENLIRL